MNKEDASEDDPLFSLSGDIECRVLPPVALGKGFLVCFYFGSIGRTVPSSGKEHFASSGARFHKSS